MLVCNQIWAVWFYFLSAMNVTLRSSGNFSENKNIISTQDLTGSAGSHAVWGPGHWCHTSPALSRFLGLVEILTLTVNFCIMSRKCMTPVLSSRTDFITNFEIPLKIQLPLLIFISNLPHWCPTLFSFFSFSSGFVSVTWLHFPLHLQLSFQYSVALQNDKRHITQSEKSL